MCLYETKNQGYYIYIYSSPGKQKKRAHIEGRGDYLEEGRRNLSFPTMRAGYIEQNLYMFIPKQKRHQLCIFYSWCQKIMYIYTENKTKNCMFIQKQKQNNYKYTYYNYFLKRKLARIVNKKKRTF